MDNIINELQNIGFTKYESQIYISLLKESPLTGYVYLRFVFSKSYIL